MKMTGAEAIIACFRQEQVPVVSGYPGGAVLGLYDALYKTGFPHILTGQDKAIHHDRQYAGLRDRWEWPLPPRGPGSAIWLPALPPPTWTPFPW